MTAFAKFRDDFLQSFYRAHPVDATFIGHHMHDGVLPDASVEGTSRRRAELARQLRSLDSLPAEDLSIADELDRELLRGVAELSLREIDNRHQLSNPAWYSGEAIFGLFSLLFTDFAPMDERLENLRLRLTAIPKLFSQAKARLTSAPAPWVARALRECDGAAHFLTDGLRHLPPHPEVPMAAATAAEAFADYRAHLEGLAGETGMEKVAIGEPDFAHILERGHLLEWSPSELAARAERALAESLSHLDEGATDWRAELGALAGLHPTRERYLDALGDCWKTSLTFAQDQSLVTWPDAPVDFVPRPAWARAAAPYLYFLFYRSPAPLDNLARHRYLVPPIDDEMTDEEARTVLQAMNDSAIKLNHVVHHGGIGHHLQNWHAARAESQIGRIAAVDGASRIAMTCGGTMAEGWACYSTDLMDEAGFLTPLESLSQHHAHARIAARAIVDVKLHCKEMTFEEASSFYVDATNMTEAAARAEVVKNSMFPGAAVIYFVGTSLIHDLRSELSRRLGPAFDLREFHDRFLSHGSVPVAWIHRKMLAEV